MMYPYSKETQFAIRGMMEAAQPFDIEDIKVLTETILEDGGKFFDPIIEGDLKNFMLTMFEKGYMPGYCLGTKYVCDEEGPKILLEFCPENAFAFIDLIDKPEKQGKPVNCTIHPEYKDLLRTISKKAKCTQDTMVRSILIKALNKIYDQLK